MAAEHAVEHLLELFDRYIRGSSQALVYDDGFRPWSYTHDQLRATAEAVVGRLTGAGLRQGDRLLLWSDSRPEWVAIFWGCLLCGVAVVPVDASTSPDLVERIAKAARPLGVCIGDGLELKPSSSSAFVWRLREIEWIESKDTPASRTEKTSHGFARARVDSSTVAEIVFTSGTTGEPKGVIITHRNIVANITPVEREVEALRRYLWPFRPIRFLSLLPLSHMFGQALSIFFRH